MRIKFISIRSVALCLFSAAAAISSQDALAQYENIGRQVGRELGRSAGGGSRIGDLIGGAVGSVLTKPLDDSARAEEQDKRDQDRAKREQERINLNNQRRLDQAAMAGREKAIREQAYQQQIEQGRLSRANPSAPAWAGD
jgi:hypothetical protein